MDNNEVMRLRSQVKELTDEAKNKSQMWEQYAAQCEIVDKHARELCEMILSKDRSQMALGDAKTWYSLSTDEMINLTKEVFTSYVKDTTATLKGVMRASEARARENENLKTQIEDYMRTGKVSEKTVEEFVDAANKKAAIKEKEADLPRKTTDAAKRGKVEVIIEEDGDFEQEELKEIANMIEIGQKAKLTPNAVPVAKSPLKTKAVEEKKEEVVSHLVNIASDLNSYGEIEWKILEAIGSFGISRYKEIETKVAESINTLNVTIRTSVTKLTQKNVLEKTVISLPLSSKCALYTLSEIGKRVYKYHFNQNPVKPELEKVIAEHDNAEHGYGIIDVQQMLLSTGIYETVSSYNRSNGIEVTVGNEKHIFVPDLICKSKKGFKDYIEYERGTHNQSNFNLKLDKMCKATKFLHIIAPNRDVLKNIKEKVDIWLEARGVEAIKAHTIRLGTAYDLSKGNGYFYEYTFKEGKPLLKTNG